MLSPSIKSAVRQLGAVVEVDRSKFARALNVDVQEVNRARFIHNPNAINISYSFHVNVQQLVFHGTPRLSILRQPLHERNSSAPSRRARTRDTSRG